MLRPRLLPLSIAILVVAGLASLVWWQSAQAASVERTAIKIVVGARDFKELTQRFEDLAEKRGGVFAYDVLEVSKLPQNTDVHLLGHTVGDVLYTQEGVDGIADCTQDFRNACSHSIVIGALNDFGEEALGMIRDSCHKAPGGTGAYTMCYHGLGHGVFAYFGYSLPETIAFCAKTGTEEYGFREYHECLGGVIMELMGGGGHDKVAWEVARKKYLSNTDPLSPCSSTLIPSDVKRFCYTYITPNLFESGGSLARPGPVEFTAAFSYCDRIPRDETKARYACFGGIGKELPVLALSRDIRQISVASKNDLAQMNAWCALAPHTEAYTACRESIQDSLFWGGENDRQVSVSFCSIVSAKDDTSCFSYLYGIAAHYLKDKEERTRLCTLVPSEMTDECTRELL